MNNDKQTDKQTHQKDNITLSMYAIRNKIQKVHVDTGAISIVK